MVGLIGTTRVYVLYFHIDWEKFILSNSGAALGRIHVSRDIFLIFVVLARHTLRRFFFVYVRCLEQSIDLRIVVCFT